MVDCLQAVFAAKCYSSSSVYVTSLIVCQKRKKIVLASANMDLMCYIPNCKRKFSDLKSAIKHVKLHSAACNAMKISCLVPNCDRTYETFDSLSVHVKKCVARNKIKTKTEKVTLNGI